MPFGWVLFPSGLLSFIRSQNVIKSICSYITYQQMTNKMFERFLTAMAFFLFTSVLSLLFNFLFVAPILRVHMSCRMCCVGVGCCVYVCVCVCPFFMCSIQVTCLSFLTSDTILFFISIVYVVCVLVGCFRIRTPIQYISSFIRIHFGCCLTTWLGLRS